MFPSPVGAASSGVAQVISLLDGALIYFGLRATNMSRLRRLIAEPPHVVSYKGICAIMFPGHMTVSDVMVCSSLAGLVGRPDMNDMKDYW